MAAGRRRPPSRPPASGRLPGAVAQRPAAAAARRGPQGHRLVAAGRIGGDHHPFRRLPRALSLPLPQRRTRGHGNDGQPRSHLTSPRRTHLTRRSTPITTDPGIVIIGASLAGAKAAQALRLDHGYDRPITLIGDEPHLPYQRPALSKGYLLGTTEAGELDVLEPRFYSDQDVTLALGAPATGLDLDARRVRIADGTELPFSQVLIATGSRARRLDLPGADLDGVHYLRDRADSDRLGTALRDAAHVVVIGAGWLGSELAAASRTLGNRTTVIDPLPTPLYTVLGDRIGGLLARR
ncbi:hypothetical protein GEV43_46810, partial [Actinomadura sp. J1-007]|nr:hypothetical protein [Actinomadura sp. J1-007]